MNHIERSKQAYARTADKQAEKGMETYGQALDPLEPGRDWLVMAEEEIVDAHQYNQAMQNRRKFVVDKIRNLITHEKNEYTNMEINHWLTFLEGKA